MPLAPGKVLVNPDWVEVAELPECVRKWDVLVAPRPSYAVHSPMAVPQFSSQWLSMNVLSLDHERSGESVPADAVLDPADGHGAALAPAREQDLTERTAGGILEREAP